MQFLKNKIWANAHLALTIILVIVLVTQFVLAHKSSPSSPKKNRSSSVDSYLLDPARVFYTDENLVTNIQPIRTYLKSLPEREKDKADISIYFEALTTGANVSVNNDLDIYPVSLAKLPLAMVVLKKTQDNKLDLTEQIELKQEDLDDQADKVFAGKVGQKYSLEFLIKKMIHDSDNIAYRMLKRQITDEEFTTIVDEVGLDVLFDPEGKVSAKEYSRLFRVLYLASYLNQTNSKYLLEVLAETPFKDFLSQGLPPDVKFAHKWGENFVFKVYSDVGIVYLNKRPYLIAVMTAYKSDDMGKNREEATALMKEISQKVYDFMKNY